MNPVAKVQLWLAYTAMLECDDLQYAYPRPEGWEAEYDRLQGLVERLTKEAYRRLGAKTARARGKAWRSAVAEFLAP